MTQFSASPMRDEVETLVLAKQMPVLGICVGMQILAESSAEGDQRGLGWIAGTVRKFADPALALPHMGWNDVRPARTAGLFNGFEESPIFYFLHTYYFDAASPESVLATSEYGGRFSSAVQQENIYGVQFHPEKSHHWGERLLKNFAEL